jgi:hypothetical protein
VRSDAAGKLAETTDSPFVETLRFTASSVHAAPVPSGIPPLLLVGPMTIPRFSYGVGENKENCCDQLLPVLKDCPTGLKLMSALAEGALASAKHAVTATS